MTVRRDGAIGLRASWWLGSLAIPVLVYLGGLALLTWGEWSGGTLVWRLVLLGCAGGAAYSYFGALNALEFKETGKQRRSLRNVILLAFIAVLTVLVAMVLQ